MSNHFLFRQKQNVYFTCNLIRYWQIPPCTALLRSPVSSHKNWRQNWHVKFGQQVSQRREIPQWAHTGHKSLIKSLNDICKGMLDRDYYHFILPTAQLFLKIFSGTVKIIYQLLLELINKYLCWRNTEIFKFGGFQRFFSPYRVSAKNIPNFKMLLSDWFAIQVKKCTDTMRKADF